MSHAAIALRPASLRDAQSIAVMSRDYIEQGLPWKYDAARIGAAIRRRDMTVLAAVDRTALAGFAIMEFGDERAHLTLMAVRPTHRRRGIGRGMFEWLLESAFTAGIESMHLELRSGNEAARRFYRAVGFSETIMIPRYYGGSESAVRMIRMLRRASSAAPAWVPPAHWR